MGNHGRQYPAIIFPIDPAISTVAKSPWIETLGSLESVTRMLMELPPFLIALKIFLAFTQLTETVTGRKPLFSPAMDPP